MEQAKTYYNKLTTHPYFNKFKKIIYNPYVAIALAILVMLYGGLMADKMPKGWLANPLFKIIFVFLVLAVHRIHPMLAILILVITTVAIMIMSNVPKPTGKHKGSIPTPEEAKQIKQELEHELKTQESGLHPMNRPTKETLLEDNRVIDPNDPHQPSIKMMDNPGLDTAIYELNPPYAVRNLPEDMEKDKINTPVIHVPEGGPTRYSAMHGYKLGN